MGDIATVIQKARDKLGWEYSMPDRWADGKADCSSLIWRSYAEAGLPLDAVATNSTILDYPSGTPIDMSEVRAGDFVYKNPDAGGYQHIGMVTDPPYVIEASSHYGVVERPNLDTWLVASRPFPDLGGDLTMAQYDELRRDLDNFFRAFKEWQDEIKEWRKAVDKNKEGPGGTDERLNALEAGAGAAIDYDKLAAAIVPQLVPLIIDEIEKRLNNG